MDTIRVDAPSGRASRARRCALIGGLAFGLIASAAGSLQAADPPADAQTAPAMPDDLIPAPPAPPTTPAAPAPADKPKSNKIEKTADAFPDDKVDKAVTPASSPTPSKAADATSTFPSTPPAPLPASSSSAGSSTSSPSTSSPPSTGPSSGSSSSGSSPASNLPPSRPLTPNGDPQYYQHEDTIDVQVRAAGIVGQGPVQDLSILPIEMFPYFTMDNSVYFADLRVFPTIDGTFGGNVGLGYRVYSPSWDRVFGISGWYDADGTRDPYLQQLGVSLETYGRWFDFRTNVYVPIGQTDQQNSVSAVANSSRFVGSNVVYDQLQGYLAAMTGVDFEAGVPLPGKFAESHNVRVYGGAYYFADDRGDHIAGGSARIQANLYSGLDASLQITNDNFFDTRAFFGLSWTYGALHRSELSDPSQRSRLGEHVTRNYTVLAPTQSQVNPNVLAIDPGTKTPYTFAHVDSSAAPGGNGSITSPFQTIAAAQASGATIVFVHAGSVFHGADATVALNSGQALLGDGGGVLHSIAVPQVGSIFLPHAPSSSALPILDSATANALTLASGVVVSGFTITNPANSGIFGNGVSNSVVQNVSVDHAGGDGILLLNSTGTVSISNATVTNSTGNGLALEGGTGNITFAGRVSGSQGYDAVVADTGGGLVDLTSLQLPGSGSQGVLLFNNAGNVNFNNLSVIGSTGRGIDIEGGSGQVLFAGTTTVSAAFAESVNIQSLLSTGTVTFDNLSIDHREGSGLVINQSAGSVTVTGTTNITNELGSNASAISISNSSGNAAFVGPVNVVNASSSPAVSLQTNTSSTTFSTLNISSVNGTGLFANDAGTLVINSAQTPGVGGTISSINGTAVDIESTNMNIFLTSVSSSNATAGIKLIASPGGFAVTGDSSNTAASGGTIQGAATGIFLQNSGTAGFQNMSLTSNGVGIQAQNIHFLGLANSTISGSASFGIDALNVGTLNIQNATFTNNGAANIRSQFNQFGAYTINLSSSTLTSTNADNLLVQALSGSEGSVLTLTPQANLFQNGSSGTAGINVSWDGTLTANIQGNTFEGTGGSNTGVLINNASTVNQSTITLTNNSFAANGGSDVGYHLITGGASLITYTGNTVQFGGPNGTGMEFSLGPNANVELSGNILNDNTGGATGILFDSVTGSSTIGIDGNTIAVPNGGGPDRGIVFTSVTDPVVSGMTFGVTLTSSQNNSVTGTSVPFSVPASTTTGGILVNGTVMP